MTELTPKKTPAAVGFDLGGTNLRAALIAKDGRVLSQHRESAPADPQSLLDTVVVMHRDLTAAHGAQDLPVALGVASLVRDRRVAVHGPNVAIGTVDLVEELGQRGLPRVLVENDSNAATYGEWQAGAARGHEHAMMVTLGTGVGGGVIVAGALLRGANGFGGEAGHTNLEVAGRLCACGRRGCLEAYTSGTAIGETARSWLMEGRPSSLTQVSTVDAIAVGKAAGDGDRFALDVLAQTGRWLGAGLVGMVNLFDPSIVVVGGGAGSAIHAWLLPAAQEVLDHEIEGAQFRTVPRLVPAHLGDDAGIVGAGLLAAHHWNATA